MSDRLRPPLAAEARRLTKENQWERASEKLQQLIADVTGIEAVSLQINRDQYSLNSLNGRVVLADGRTLFFKFHHEEGEEHTIDEYYRAELLREHGFAVDVPVYTCGEPGRQILLYSLRNDQRLADVCRAVESAADWEQSAAIIEAQRRADSDILAHTLPTLRMARAAEVAAESIHQLFWNRLVSAGALDGLGGRVAQFYVGQRFTLGEVQLDWETLSQMHWQVNGVLYPQTLHQLFMAAGEVLKPAALASHGVVVAHGDAHNANVWYETQHAEPELVSFDPAFAGSNIPALLAEIKATFHNIYAHPCWLYEPDDAAARYQVNVRCDGNTLIVEHDWQLSPLRRAFLTSKGELYWKPLLAVLQEKGWLPGNWQQIMRLALFCCPTLVMNLRAGSSSNHNPTSSAIGFSVAVMLACGGEDEFTHWIDNLITEN